MHRTIEEIASDIQAYDGKEVELRGWLYNRRSKGKILFLLLRDGSGVVQCVALKDEVPEEVFDRCDTLPRESSVEVRGVAREDARAPGGVEISLKDLTRGGKGGRVTRRPAGGLLDRRWVPVASACLAVLAALGTYDNSTPASRRAAAMTIGADKPPPAKTPPATPPAATQTTLKGRVVWMAEVLKQRRGIESGAEAERNVLALETPDGNLVPLIEDVRGRAFRRDDRLRHVPVELLVRRFPDTPFVQVVGLFATERGQRVAIDYWCEVCAIQMFELKDCECCQGPIELRKRPSPAPRDAGPDSQP
jgi:hypothetical protein